MSISARELFSTIQEELDQKEEFKDGLSFLDLKNDTLLSYMIDVCNIVLRKVRGETIEGHKSVERCVEYRVILEKIKAVDMKLAYQLNKLITMPDDAQEEEDQRIDVKNLDIHLEGTESDEDKGDNSDNETDDESDEELDEEGLSENDDGSDESVENVSIKKSQEPQSVKASGVYKPPKLRSVAYLEKGESRDKGRRKNYDEFYLDDDEARDIVDEGRVDRVDEERVRFEENNYTRLPDENPKKIKRKLKTKEYRKKGKSNKFKRRRK